MAAKQEQRSTSEQQGNRWKARDKLAFVVAPEFRRRQHALIARAERRRKLRNLARNAVLKTLKVLRIKSPYQMNR